MRKGYKVTLTSVNTGKEYHFKSGREASLFLNRARSYVSTCIYHEMPIKERYTGELYIASFPEQDKTAPKPKRAKEQLCCTCGNAYGGCPWSARFEPVEGWTANPTVIVHGSREMSSYQILDCPLYERG